MQSLIDLCALVLRNNIKYLNFHLLPLDLHQPMIKKLKDEDFIIKPVRVTTYSLDDIEFLSKIDTVVSGRGCLDDLPPHRDIIDRLLKIIDITTGKENKIKIICYLYEIIYLKLDIFEKSQKFIQICDRKLIEFYNDPGISDVQKSIFRQLYIKIFKKEI